MNNTIGMRQYADHFADVEGELEGFGSLGGAAIQNHSKVSTKPQKDGVHFFANCDNCGTHNDITAEWPEIIFCSVGKLPPNGFWKYGGGRIHTDVGCRQCRRPMHIGVTPEECKRWVMAAVNAKIIDPQAAEQVAAKARATR